MDLPHLQHKNRHFHVITVHGIAQTFEGNSTENNDGNKTLLLGNFALQCYGATRTTNFTYTAESYHRAAIKLLGQVKQKVDSDGVFVGTPQRAMGLESWQTMAAKLVLKGRFTAACSLSTVIDRLARMLMVISQEFQGVSALYNIISFYDPADSSASLSFPRDASIMGSTTEVVEAMGGSQVSIDVALGGSEMFVQLIEREMARTFATERSRVECLNVLSNLGLTRLVDNTNCLKATFPGTFDWLFQTPEYQQWHQRSSEILWLHGWMKSEMTALSYAIQCQLIPSTITIRFSFKAHDDRYHSAQNMVASLSYQLLMLKPFLFDRVQTLCDIILEEGLRRIDQLWAFLRSLLESPGLGDIVCVVHMVDGCDSVVYRVLYDISLILPHPGSTIKLIITSPTASKLRCWGNTKAYIDLNLEASQVDYVDFRAHWRMKFALESETSEVIKYHPELKELCLHIRNFHNDNQETVAVLVALRLLRHQYLESSDLGLTAVARFFSCSLPQVFDYFLKKAPEDRFLWWQCALSWIALARRPLRLDELAIALALQDLETLSLANLQDRVMEDISIDLNYTLGNLVVIRNGEVTLLNDKFRDYLLAPVEGTSRTISLLNDAALAKTCLDYLELVAHKMHQPTAPEGSEYALSEYAIQYWARHYNLGQEHVSPQLRNRALAFTENSWPQIRARRAIIDSTPSNVLYDAVGLRCADLVSEIIHSRPLDSAVTTLALELAIENGDEQIVRLLRDVGVDSPLKVHMAALHGREGLVDQFLSSESKIALGTAPSAHGTAHDGKTPLHLAAMAGYHCIISRLLDANLDINIQDQRGRTPLHLASQCGHMHAIEELLRRGADPSIKDHEDLIPLHMACRWQHQRAALRLLGQACGAKQVSTLTATNQTALHLSAGGGCEYVVDAIFYSIESDEYGPALRQKDSEGRTPLHVAAQHGRNEVVRSLLSKASQVPPIATLQDGNGNTPLHLAIRNGHYRVVDKLATMGKTRSKYKKRGASEFDVQTDLMIQDGGGQLPIHLAVRSGDARVVQKICDYHLEVGKPLDVFDSKSQSPLHIAAQDGLADITNILLASGAEPDIGDDKSRTPLLLACKSGHISTTKLLLRAGADPIYTDSSRRSALHEAVESGTVPMVKEVLEASRVMVDGSTFIGMRDDKDNTALHLAAKRGDIEIMRALLSPDIVQNRLQVPDGKGRSLLSIALDQNKLDMMGFLVQTIKAQASGDKTDNSADGDWEDIRVVKALLEVIPFPHAADESAIHPEGQNKVREIVDDLLKLTEHFGSWDTEEYGPALRLAAKKGVVQIVEKLIRVAKTEPQNSGPTMHEAILLAAENGQRKVVKLLLNGVDIDENKRKGFYSAFPIAAENGHLELLKSLATDYKTWVNHENHADALKLASKNGQLDIVSFLLSQVDRTDPAVKLSMNSALGNALMLGKTEVVSILLSHGADLDSVVQSVSTPLHQAVSGGHVSLCKLLLQKRPSDLNVRDSDGRTALYTAAWYRQGALVDILLRASDIDVEAADPDGWRPIHAAYDSSSITRELLNAKAQVDAITNDSETALFKALRGGHEETAAELLKRNANPLHQSNTGDTPLHVAARVRLSREFLQHMLSKVKQSPDVRNKNGRSPLSIAAETGSVKLVAELLTREDVDINQIDEKGGSPLWHATANNCVEVANLLRQNRKLEINLSLQSASADDLFHDP
ncbi:putative ankyrin [Rosellinia necatrix]|uniref:Putative ankyrin n=1 Tax=Rosellinia necatrix TaxID=77044 RepID=A0A1W2TW00_ROSNE|nr:putative ankyrin [Rosellinia necatrix]